jgi:chemotaxis protein methyltransferase CheR
MMANVALKRTWETSEEGAPSHSLAARMTSAAIPEDVARELIALIYQHSGIVLLANKEAMIASRLAKRLRALELASFRDYLDYLKVSPSRESEIVTMVSEITTNKTAFFRESHHFDYLTATILPALAGHGTLNIWSAGCSTGEEPYTLAMVLTDYFGTPEKFNILAIDLSTHALRAARLGIYADHAGQPIPQNFRQKYTLEGRGPQAGFFRIVPELRERIRFGHFNLVDRDWDIPAEMDLIFCRNVMIYFDKKTRKKIVAHFGQKLRMGGHFFVGHSESLSDLESDLVQVRPTVYTRGRR